MTWKFKIHETVRHQSGFNAFIRERITVECIGGIQAYYRCTIFRPIEKSNKWFKAPILIQNAHDFFEAELSAIEPTTGEQP